MQHGGLKKVYSLLIILSFLMIFPLCAGGADAGRLYPVTILEMQKIVSRWLQNSGYQVSQSGLADGSIQLKGVRENEHWNIVLHSHSPLYSSFEAQCLADGRPSEKRIQELSAFLNDYVAKNVQVSASPKNATPPSLLRIHCVVCLTAFSGGTPIHFSGFVVDRQGIILSTAHDLDDVKDVTVTTSDGRTLKGRLIRRDPDRDLAMIRVESRLKDSLNFNGGRNFLKKGEPVYALTCLDGERRTLSGVISQAVKIQDDLRLWQVEMETPRGSSGSPVFDRNGKIIAMVKGRYRGNPSIGFVIPLETILTFLKEK